MPNVNPPPVEAGAALGVDVDVEVEEVAAGAVPNEKPPNAGLDAPPPPNREAPAAGAAEPEPLVDAGVVEEVLVLAPPSVNDPNPLKPPPPLPPAPPAPAAEGVDEVAPAAAGVELPPNENVALPAGLAAVVLLVVLLLLPKEKVPVEAEEAGAGEAVALAVALFAAAAPPKLNPPVEGAGVDEDGVEEEAAVPKENPPAAGFAAALPKEKPLPPEVDELVLLDPKSPALEAGVELEAVLVPVPAGEPNSEPPVVVDAPIIALKGIHSDEKRLAVDSCFGSNGEFLDLPPKENGVLAVLPAALFVLLLPEAPPNEKFPPPNDIL